MLLTTHHPDHALGIADKTLLMLRDAVHLYGPAAQCLRKKTSPACTACRCVASRSIQGKRRSPRSCRFTASAAPHRHRSQTARPCQPPRPWQESIEEFRGRRHEVAAVMVERIERGNDQAAGRRDAVIVKQRAAGVPSFPIGGTSMSVCARGGGLRTPWKCQMVSANGTA